MLSYINRIQRDGETLMVVGALGFCFFAGYLLGVFMGVLA